MTLRSGDPSAFLVEARQSWNRGRIMRRVEISDDSVASRAGSASVEFTNRCDRSGIRRG